MSATRFRLAITTTADRAEAERLAQDLVRRRLAACVNIIENMTSMFWWEGEVRDGRETVLIAKTQAERMSALVEAVKAVHSYTCPCVVALPIEEGNPDFLEWIREETAAGRQ